MERCAYCREEIQGESTEWQGHSYCCEACAFEASLKSTSICGSRNSVEASLRYWRGKRSE